ncbi:MAG: cytochrome c biogenesis protein CcdA [Armatimonadota bacterium]|nr:cytochrome c biogenesis protein CcdA [Armatimonadota bacterium]
MKTQCLKLAILLLVVLSLCVSAGVLLAAAEDPVVTGRLVVSQSALRPGDEFEIAFCGRVKPGCHIGAAQQKNVYPAQLTIQAPRIIQLGRIVYPKPAVKITSSGEALAVYEGNFVIKATARVRQSAKPGSVRLVGRFKSQGCTGNVCYPPEEFVAHLTVRIVPWGTVVKPTNKAVFGSRTGVGKLSGEQQFAKTLASRSLILQLLMLYAFGLLLAFTPCVYPMIPVTVGYFSAQGESQTRRVIALAGVYVLGIALTYSLLGTAAALTGSVFGELMQNRWVLAGISALLAILALSMFGLYEIRPPGFIEERASGRKGVLGALMMGLIFGVVAAPCVGPAVLGLMLYVAKLGSPVMGFILFFVLALGIGTPLFLLAAFSAKLPAAGMWMVAIRKAAGFLLLGAAAYFARSLVPGVFREFLIPAVVVAAGINFILFEASLLSNRKTAIASRVLGGLLLCAAAAMIARSYAPKQILRWEPYSFRALSQASENHVPVIVDFTADWCAVCKELERETFADPRVISEAQRFRRFRVDATDRSDPRVKAALERHSVKGFPTVILFDRSGREVPGARVVGFVDADQFLKLLRSVK